MKILDDEDALLPKPGILLWDIDGTLVRKSGKSSSSAHLWALGLDQANSSKLELSGLSDWQVLERYSGLAKLSKNSVKEAFFKLDQYRENQHQDTLELCPGISDSLLEKLSDHWRLGILTGNTTFRAKSKLEKVGLLKYFDSKLLFCCKEEENRSDIAARASRSLGDLSKKTIIIGDTEEDIRVAKVVGFSIVSVATGLRNVKELRNFSPDLVLENLELPWEDLDKRLNELIRHY